MLRLRWIFCKKRRDKDGEMCVKNLKEKKKKEKTITRRQNLGVWEIFFVFQIPSVKSISLVGESYLRKKKNPIPLWLQTSESTFS